MLRPPDTVSVPDMRNYSNARNPYGSNMSLLGGAAISAGASLLGSLFSNNSASKALKAQREENRLNREFNMQEAQKNRDFQRQMFDAENDYNDPKKVVARLMQAGLNPALAYGNFANSASAQSGSSASYSGGVSPAIPDWSGIGSAGRSFLDSQLMQAQVDNINAQTEKTKAETPWIDRMNSLIAKDKFMDISLKKFNLEKLQPQELENLVKTGEQIDSTIKTLNSTARLTEHQANIAAKDENVRDLLNNAQIRKLFADTEFTQAQELQLLYLLPATLKKMQSETNLNNANAALAWFENEINQEAKNLFGMSNLAGQKYQQVSGTLRSFGHNVGELLKGVLDSDTYETLSSAYHFLVGLFDVLKDISNAIHL